LANFVQIVGKEIRVNTSTVAEAKFAIKELKLKKKEYSLQKRAVTDKQKEIRAQYTDEVRSRGSMMRGGGGLGKFVRAVQSASRDSKRAQLANALAPYENQKQDIDAILRAIDSAILQVEAAILKHGG
jgi:hypothetical protein